LSQDTFAAQTLKGVPQRWWINSNTSRKLIRLQPGKEIFLSLSAYVIPVLAFFPHGPLACQSIENDFEKASVILKNKTKNKQTNKKLQFVWQEKKFIEESKLHKYVHVNTDNTLLNTTALRTLRTLEALHDMCLHRIISPTQRGNRKSLNFVFIKGPKNQHVCRSA